MQTTFLKRLLFTSLFFSLLLFTAHAQYTISGNVIDSRTGESIIGATLAIENTAIATASDINGNFTLKNIPEGKHILLPKIT